MTDTTGAAAHAAAPPIDTWSPTPGVWLAEEAPLDPNTTHINVYDPDPQRGEAGWLADVANFNEADPLVMAASKDLYEALDELVALKAMKDADGKSAEYEARQLLAWDQARTALAKARGATS